ncbi:MAG: (2Fe-2S)-binding protein [Pseudomonadota bacterium]|nr:(2Fe-2S)-binding protein [Pseudomonadota bacterium]
MFVCSCNAIREIEAGTAIKTGARNWVQVHAHLGHAPCCGKCASELTEMISLAEPKSPTETALLMAAS